MNQIAAESRRVHKFKTQGCIDCRNGPRWCRGLGSFAVVLSDDTAEFGSATNFTLSLGDELFVENRVVPANTAVRLMPVIWLMMISMPEPGLKFTAYTERINVHPKKCWLTWISFWLICRIPAFVVIPIFIPWPR